MVRPRLQDYTQKVAQLIATDKDLCATPNDPPADCQILKYRLVYGTREKRLFRINSNGDIYFNSENDFEDWKSIGSASFTVVARNYREFGTANGSTRVTVVNGRPYGFFEVPSDVSAIRYPNGLWEAMFLG
ncbi:unnamed protein product [Mesocestoides corti]|uniref:SH3 domain-containing protein n=1 Tax=Mesocestoides corti TaxID=53468 RepID=A0A0R3UA23_MESCO|nr:unnamed protein product [Mesocestoides corti]